MVRALALALALALGLAAAINVLLPISLPSGIQTLPRTFLAFSIEQDRWLDW